MTRNWLEVVVGAVVCGVIVLLIVGGVSGGFAATRAGYVVTARFDQADGLAVGNPVYLAGVQVGKVSAMRLDPKTLQPIVDMRIDDGIEIPIDSAAMILSDGVLGGKFIKIEPGIETSYLKPGGRFDYVQDSVIVEELLQQIVNSAEKRLGGK
jgi:phospholipid/cholesterol/gamma-HCH transport system substrate-binding protein